MTFTLWIIVYSWFQSIRAAHNACVSTRTNKHVAQNLDNPTWRSEDPFCGFNPDYLGSSDTLAYWNVMDTGLFGTNSWDQRWCGMCLQVTKHGAPTPSPSVVVKLVDHPTSYDFELRIDTYESLGLDMDEDTDYIDVTPVVCPIDGALTRPYLSYELGGISHYYLEIVVWDHIVPIQSASVKGSSWGSWESLTRSTWNEFESNNLPELQAPFELKIVSVFGEAVIETFSTWPSKNSFVQGSVQFTDTDCMATVDGSTTPSTTSTTATTAFTTTESSASTTASTAFVTTETSASTTAAATTGATSDHDACIGTKTNKESCINLDNPKWSGEDPWCGYNPNYATSDVTLRHWNVLKKTTFDSGTWDTRWCGMCLKVTKHGGDGSSFEIVKLVDHTSGYDFELQVDTYTAVGLSEDAGSGYIDVTPVVCPIDNDLTRDYLGYELGSIDHYYLEIVVWDHIVPIESAYVLSTASSWSSGWFKLKRSTWNEFESNNLPKFEAPFQLKVISIFGEEVIQDFETWPSKNSFVVGSVQFSNTGCMATVEDGTVTPTTTSGVTSTASATTETSESTTAAATTAATTVATETTFTTESSASTTASTAASSSTSSSSTSSSASATSSTTSSTEFECTEWSLPEFEDGKSWINEDPHTSDNFYCQFNPAFADTDAALLWIGVDFDLYDSHEDVLCGACLKVTNPNTAESVIGKVAQKAGSGTDVELFEDTFTSIGGVVSSGKISGLRVVQVPCPIDNELTKSLLRYQFMSGTSKYWMSIVIWDHVVPVAKVYIQWNGHTDWEMTDRTQFNEFKYSSGNTKMNTPWKFKIVSVFGEELFEDISTFDTSGLVEGTVQFATTSCGSEPNDPTSSSIGLNPSLFLFAYFAFFVLLQ